ncbi:hypothetical protein QMG83_09025 [Salinibacterium sp. G-O1]|uniref:hypothetical protein n=1 Tax=Salinibacterium sp. G-O1 TaxID=3046208 RepID=UPI0024B9BABC|nr:hypothetical protein [Salinibacterium sp. G-O1]MDJ0335364.1 hypothetical protein [Salinibacterium sp. G-O1]
MFRPIALAVLVLALAGCSGLSSAEQDEAPRPTQTTQPTQDASPTAVPEPAPECLMMSATWVAHIQGFMEEGYTVTRGSAVPSGGRYFSVALLYTSPSGEEILGSWGAGEDPSGETTSMVFPLDDVTASHTVVMMPVSNVIAEAGAGIGDATACLG